MKLTISYEYFPELRERIARRLRVSIDDEVSRKLNSLLDIMENVTICAPTLELDEEFVVAIFG